jgi:putative membrane protein
METDRRVEERRTDLAEVRTDLARERNALAQERTLSAWLRTGLAAVAAGVGLVHLAAGSPAVLWLVRAAGLSLVLLGGAIFAVALRRHARLAERPAAPRTLVPLWLLTAFAVAIFAGALLALLAALAL